MDPELAAMVKLLPKMDLADPVAARQAFEEILVAIRIDIPGIETLDIEDRLVPGWEDDPEVSVRVYRPAGASITARVPGIVMIHGGGFVIGSVEAEHAGAALMAMDTGAVVVSVDYRLAPEHPFPAGVEDAIAAVTWVSQHAQSLGIDGGRFVVGGDSAGATLAAVVCQEALRSGGPAISVQCLICPVLDFEETSPSREAFAENHLLDMATLEADLALYLPEGTERGDPRVSPLRAVKFAGLPAAIIHTAEFDPMRDEGNAYAAKLIAAGVEVEHFCHDGMIHNFQALGAVLPQGRLVLRQIGEQIRRVHGD